MRTLTISELEKVTGVPRGTIYHYVREGLIPPSLETGHRTGLYTEEHARLLTRIRRLRRHRLSLDDIREHIQQADHDQPDDEINLAIRREAELRARILSAATRRFAEKGYRKTGVDEIIAELEIAPGTLYRFFPTKKDLFVQSIRCLIGESTGQIESQAAHEAGLAARNLRRVNGLLKIAAAHGEMLLAARAEALGEDDELERLVRQTYSEGLRPMIDDLRAIAGEAMETSALDPELMGYAIMGAVEAMLMRISWDERYSEDDAASVLALIYGTMLSALADVRSLKDALERCTANIDARTDTYGSSISVSTP